MQMQRRAAVLHSLEALIYFSMLGFNMKAFAFAVIVVVYTLLSTSTASGKRALSTTSNVQDSVAGL